MPGSDDPTLPDWMFDPTKTLNCKVVLKRIDTNATLKTIKFYNAYCVGMVLHFDGTANASSFRLSIRISPEQFDINGLFHDNRWPDESPIQQIADEDGSVDVIKQANPPVRLVSTKAVQPAWIQSVATVQTVISTCPDSIRIPLRNDVDRLCKAEKNACKSPDSCPVLEGKMEAHVACIQARTLIMVKCYKGGDVKHKGQVQNRINGLIRCQEIYFSKCGSNIKPIPAPQKAPSPAPMPPVTDPDFMKKMEELTGLTGAALIIYLIIPEGSRLFPPRNVIPIP